MFLTELNIEDDYDAFNKIRCDECFSSSTHARIELYNIIQQWLALNTGPVFHKIPIVSRISKTSLYRPIAFFNTWHIKQ